MRQIIAKVTLEVSSMTAKMELLTQFWCRYGMILELIFYDGENENIDFLRVQIEQCSEEKGFILRYTEKEV